MHHRIARFSGLRWLTLLMTLCVLLPAPSTQAQEQERTAQVVIAYPPNFEDEHEHPFKQPVKVEFYRILSEEARQRIIAGLEKQKRQADAPTQKERLDREIERMAKERARLEYATVVEANTNVGGGGGVAAMLPIAEYEVHFIPINPANRKLVITPLALTQNNARLTIAISPQGGVIGGEPTIAEMKAQIEELQKLVAALQERVHKLESAK